MRLILASASPRRADLLRAAGFTFETVAADVDEAVRAGESPALYVRRLAAEKSAAARSAEASRSSGDGTRGVSRAEPIILAADTTVVVDGTILGKPHTDDEAAAMLESVGIKDVARCCSLASARLATALSSSDVSPR